MLMYINVREGLWSNLVSLSVDCLNLFCSNVEKNKLKSLPESLFDDSMTNFTEG